MGGNLCVYRERDDFEGHTGDTGAVAHMLSDMNDNSVSPVWFAYVVTRPHTGDTAQ